MIYDALFWFWLVADDNTARQVTIFANRIFEVDDARCSVDSFLILNYFGLTCTIYEVFIVTSTRMGRPQVYSKDDSLVD